MPPELIDFASLGSKSGPGRIDPRVTSAEQDLAVTRAFMTIETPPFLGLILRKNERTRAFIERQTKLLMERVPDGGQPDLNEDEHIIALSVAMNGHVLQAAIEELERQQAVYGTDFVATSSADGVLGDTPSWLCEKVVRMGPYQQLTKVYSFMPDDRSQR